VNQGIPPQGQSLAADRFALELAAPPSRYGTQFDPRILDASVERAQSCTLQPGIRAIKCVRAAGRARRLPGASALLVTTPLSMATGYVPIVLGEFPDRVFQTGFG
jgi:hypothetical protein